MPNEAHRGRKKGSSRLRGVIPVLAFALMASSLVVSAAAFANEAKLSEEHSMHLKPSAIEKVGEENYKRLIQYFQDAERAIESEDLEELMVLYSQRYSNRDQDKEFARGVWRKIFDDFDNVSAKHSMELLTYDVRTGQPVAVLECSGLLQGTPKAGGQSVKIDSWDSQWHVLVNEGEWRLYGNSGLSGKRFGSGDQQMHPLF
ncbi:MAG: hypothetical protein GY910_26455 [bacterium]|nr:hypothetical protein [Deltaproteobacteria bacterium]MCP4908532.1 hypothetical protein [bacterium]